MKTGLFLRGIAAICLSVCLHPWAGAQDNESVRSKLPPPDHAEVAYGPFPLNRMDVWLAKSSSPTPVMMYFHGGGFVAGSKENLPASLLAAVLKAGISVVAANYRLAPAAVFPAHYLDCARAIQFTRQSAKDWNIDPSRVVLNGSSAGAGTSLWIAFHPDLADPKSSDPVARQSTHVTCVMISGGQPTYDPREVLKISGPAAAAHPVFRNLYGLKADELNTEKAYRLFEAAAAVTYLTPQAPPVFAYYFESRKPVPPGSRAGSGIHHPNMGYYLKQKMDAVHVECIVRVKEDGGSVLNDEMAFLKLHLGL